MIHTDFADILKCHKMTAILNKFTFTTCFEHVRINDEMHHLSLSFSFVVLPLHSPPSLPHDRVSLCTQAGLVLVTSLPRAAECRDYHMCQLQLPLLCSFHVSYLRVKEISDLLLDF